MSKKSNERKKSRMMLDEHMSKDLYSMARRYSLEYSEFTVGRFIGNMEVFKMGFMVQALQEVEENDDEDDII